MSHNVYCTVLILLLVSYNAHGWVCPLSSSRPRIPTRNHHHNCDGRTTSTTSLNVQSNDFPFVKSLTNIFTGRKDKVKDRAPAPQNCRARDLVQALVREVQCFAAEERAEFFGAACASDVIYEDCFESQLFVGRYAVTNHLKAKARQRKGKGDVRIDRISDGDRACGFAWTWISGREEGLRGTTFVQLNDEGMIQYVREIPEPLYKPGDATLELLKAVTKGATPKPPPVFEQQTPKTANEIAKYLFLDVQGGDVDESMRFFDESIIYRDFNYEEPLNGKAEVRKFIQDFSFPGIRFIPELFDDGVDSCCFTWEVCLEGQTQTVKGISFYELDPDTRLIRYVRDVPESAIKPPPLGNLARIINPGLGVFKGVPVGSRPGGM